MLTYPKKRTDLLDLFTVDRIHAAAYFKPVVLGWIVTGRHHDTPLGLQVANGKIGHGRRAHADGHHPATGGGQPGNQSLGIAVRRHPAVFADGDMGMAMKLSEIKPDAIYLTSCLVNAKPACPYSSPEEMAEIIKGKTGSE